MRQLTIEYVRKQFEKRSCILRTKKYINCDQKLDYICSEGHEHSITWSRFRNGHGCPFCYGNVKYTIEFVRTEFEKKGCQLLTKVYIDNKQMLDYICPNGHRHSISWSHFKNGSGCPHCSGNAKPTMGFIRSEFEKEGWILESTEYINNKQKLDCICSNGHKHSVSWNEWLCLGNRCPFCVGLAKPTIEYIKADFNRNGYILKTKEYINAHQKLSYICPKGHKHSISWNNWKTGNRCPYCVGRISSEEVEVRNFIESLGVKVSPNNRSQIFNPETSYGFELDIFIPTLNKAVEYNGEYWHKDKSKDLLKQQLCKSKGIDLLTVWDNEWKTDNGKCKDKIKSFISNNSSNFIAAPKNFGECI